MEQFNVKNPGVVKTKNGLNGLKRAAKNRVNIFGKYLLDSIRYPGLCVKTVKELKDKCLLVVTVGRLPMDWKKAFGKMNDITFAPLSFFDGNIKPHDLRESFGGDPFDVVIFAAVNPIIKRATANKIIRRGEAVEQTNQKTFVVYLTHSSMTVAGETIFTVTNTPEETLAILEKEIRNKKRNPAESIRVTISKLRKLASDRSVLTKAAVEAVRKLAKTEGENVWLSRRLVEIATSTPIKEVGIEAVNQIPLSRSIDISIPADDLKEIALRAKIKEVRDAALGRMAEIENDNVGG